MPSSDAETVRGREPLEMYFCIHFVSTGRQEIVYQPRSPSAPSGSSWLSIRMLPV